MLGVVSAAAKLAGVACDILHVEHEHVYQAIIEAATARKCDLVVIASHGVAVSQRLSLAARQSKCSRTPRFLYSFIGRRIPQGFTAPRQVVTGK